MFKISSKSFTQQRAVLKPLKNSSAAIIEEEEEADDDDDTSSCYSVAAGPVTKYDSNSRHDTMMLAQFFSTTGPEEYISPSIKNDSTKQQFKRASRLLSRLRKKPTLSALHQQTDEKRTHIPLPAYKSPEDDLPPVSSTQTDATLIKKTTTQHPLRDSGVYSETASDRDSFNLPPVPTPQAPFLSDLQQFPQPPFSYKNFPRRPPPLPPAVASAAIASACSPTTLRSVPEAALKRRSVRLRHVQVQTEQEETSEERRACPHCRQSIGVKERMRRPSCPPALSSGCVLTASMKKDEYDTKALLAMVVQLKSQLAEEKQSRIKLENQMSKKDELAKEKDKWAGDCLWLNDRIALLPE